MHNDMIQIGGVIRAARETKKMTQTALADATGTVHRTIMDIENGKRRPSYEVLGRILHVLDLSADRIFWPGNNIYTLEQEQLFTAILSCDEWNQEVIMEIVWAYIRTVRTEKGAKKQTAIKPSAFAVP